MNFLMSITAQNLKVQGATRHGNSEFFLSHTCDETIKCLSLKEDQVLRFT